MVTTTVSWKTLTGIREQINLPAGAQAHGQESHRCGQPRVLSSHSELPAVTYRAFNHLSLSEVFILNHLLISLYISHSYLFLSPRISAELAFWMALPGGVEMQKHGHGTG